MKRTCLKCGKVLKNSGHVFHDKNGYSVCIKCYRKGWKKVSTTLGINKNSLKDLWKERNKHGKTSKKKRR